jgi:choline dehydrogenase-like flavoprotein
MTPNIARPRSRGRIWLADNSPLSQPKIDFGYFTDPEGYDERMLVEGILLARKIAAQEPMKSWIKRETFPGPEVTDREELSKLLRATHHTVYHPSGTCRMGASEDGMAVVDPELRVRGVNGLRVVDASVLPTLSTTNPVVTILMVAERAADLMRDARARDINDENELKLEVSL